MLIARDSDKNLWDAGLAKKDRDYFCQTPCCNKQLVLRKGRVKIHHFAHRPHEICKYPYYEPESLEHLSIKNLLYDYFKEDAKFIQKEFWIDNEQRPDIFIELYKGIKIAIEVQCSRITLRELLERTQKYSSKNIYCLWVLGWKKWKNSLDYNKEFRITEVEKKLHWTHFGWVYYSTPISFFKVKFGLVERKSRYGNTYFLRNTRCIREFQDLNDKKNVIVTSLFNKGVKIINLQSK